MALPLLWGLDGINGSEFLDLTWKTLRSLNSGCWVHLGFRGLGFRVELVVKDSNNRLYSFWVRKTPKPKTFGAWTPLRTYTKLAGLRPRSHALKV